MSPSRPLDLLADGAGYHPGAAADNLAAIGDTLAGIVPRRGGVRLFGRPHLSSLVGRGTRIGALATEALGPDTRPVRAVLFDKTPDANCNLGWHQDRTIVVRERHALPGWGPWGRKAGAVHVAPPLAVIAAMVTLRIHLDPVSSDNAPLLIAPGTHRIGWVAADRAAAIASGTGQVACLAAAGDVWRYSTPILHASAPSTADAGSRRRVLQIDYSAATLPLPLAWLGLDDAPPPLRAAGDGGA